MINSKNMLGGRYIGEGTYGCIFRPNLPCPGYGPNEKYVSKIIKNDKETIDSEFTNLHTKFNIPSIDPDNKYFIVPIHKCEIDDINEDDLKPSDQLLAKNRFNKGCSEEQISRKFQKELAESKDDRKKELLARLNTVRTQLILPYGGEDISKIRKNDSPESKPNIDSIWPSYLNLIKGLVLLNKNNIIHRDIKSPNIVYNDGTMKYIDMGLALKMSDDYSDYNTTPYLYWPADYMSATRDYYDNVLILSIYDSRVKKITKIIRGLFTDHNRNIDNETIIKSYTKYVYNGWILDDNHKKYLMKTLLRFMINYRADEKYTESIVEKRTKETFDVFSLGAFFCEELKKLPNDNSAFVANFKELAIKMTSFDPFERPVPIELFKLFIKIIKNDILDKSEHHTLNSHIEEVNSF